MHGGMTFQGSPCGIKLLRNGRPRKGLTTARRPPAERHGVRSLQMPERHRGRSIQIDRMHILFLCHRVPYPPDKGDRVRSYRLLRQLGDLGEVDLAFLTDEPVSGAARRHLREHCRQVASSPMGGWRRWPRAAWFRLRGRSATNGLFYSRALRQTIDGWLRQTDYDAVVCFSSSVLQYVLGRGVEHKLVVDLVDVDSQKWLDYAARNRPPLSWVFRGEARQVRRLEQRAAAGRAVGLVSEAEAELYRSIAPGANVVAATNGVDLEYFHPAPAPCATAIAPNCLFVGYLDYRANVLGLQWFCREVWPELRRRFPEAVFRIVGRNAVAAVKELSMLSGVELVGAVDDVRPYLAAAAAVAVPLPVARGIQNKVLEAMAAGKAVVATTAALEGIACTHEHDALRADTPKEWIAALSTVWMDQGVQASLGANARRYVEQYHHWSQCLRPLIEAVAELEPSMPYVGNALLGVPPDHRTGSTPVGNALSGVPNPERHGARSLLRDTESVLTEMTNDLG